MPCDLVAMYVEGQINIWGGPEDYDSEELLEILIEQTDKNQKRWLFDKMGEILQMEANVKMFKPQTIDEEIKFEAFILDIKPLLNERQDYLF